MKTTILRTCLLLLVFYGLGMALLIWASPPAVIASPSQPPVQYDREILRRTYLDCIERIKHIRELDRWYLESSHCGQKARLESQL